MTTTENGAAPEPMTRAERAELAKLLKLRARVAKEDVNTREAHLLADFEAQMASRYDSRDEAWADVTAAAKKAVEEADAEVAKRCRELGIPAEFRPGINCSWYGRGENADRSRRVELRKVAQTRLAANARAAKVEIDRTIAELLTQLTAGALESGSARDFLDAMPSIDQLLPPLALRELVAATR
jgi:hypothetical protein